MWSYRAVGGANRGDGSAPMSSLARAAESGGFSPGDRLTAARRTHPAVRSVLDQPGMPLPGSIRGMAPVPAGHEFASVRIHIDSTAANAAESLGARAFTVGNHVVFGRSQFDADAGSGRDLLRHELAHVTQQARARQWSHVIGPPDDEAERLAREGQTDDSGDRAPVIQRDSRVGPAATGAPADWAARVGAATTSADRAALVHEAIGWRVVDRTTASEGDRYPDAAHLVAFDVSSHVINYDDGLGTKRAAGSDHRSLSRDAGYTLRHGSQNYVVLGPPALEPDNFFATRVTVNHEVDHVRQYETGSSLRGDESEVDAWTSSFVREFHRLYTVLVRTNACYIDHMSQFGPLNDYFERSTVSDPVRERSVTRIAAYHRAVIATHPIHRQVFKRWVWLGLRGPHSGLATRVNAALGLGIDAAQGQVENRTLDCAAVRGATFPPGPSVVDPTAAQSGESRSGSRLGLELRGGASFEPATTRAAIGLGLRIALRSDQMVVINPGLGAHLLYLPGGGPSAGHVAAALGEIGVRIQQPLRGFYGDVRAGGFVGIALPAPDRGPGTGAEVVGGLSGSVGAGYRWERLELGVEGRALIGTDASRVTVLGVGSLRF